MAKVEEKKIRGNGLNKSFIDFSSVKNMTLGEIYGDQPVPITALVKRIWEVIKQHDLKVKKDK